MIHVRKLQIKLKLTNIKAIIDEFRILIFIYN